MLDDENIAYSKAGQYPFTCEEYGEVFDALEQLASNKDRRKHARFEEYRASFNYQGIEFVWRLMIGQGAACQLWMRDDNSDWLDQKTWFEADDVFHLTDAILEDAHRVVQRGRNVLNDFFKEKEEKDPRLKRIDNALKELRDGF